MNKYQLERPLFMSLLAVVLFSASIPIAKQAYVLYREKSSPDYYPLKSMSASLGYIKALIKSSEDLGGRHLRICSRDNYSASLYLLVELIKNRKAAPLQVSFPLAVSCKEFTKSSEGDSGRWLYLGGGRRPMYNQ